MMDVEELVGHVVRVLSAVAAADVDVDVDPGVTRTAVGSAGGAGGVERGEVGGADDDGHGAPGRGGGGAVGVRGAVLEEDARSRSGGADGVASSPQSADAEVAAPAGGPPRLPGPFVTQAPSRSAGAPRVLVGPVVRLLRADADVDAALTALEAKGAVHCTPNTVVLAALDGVLPAAAAHGDALVVDVADAMNVLALETPGADRPLIRALLDTYPAVIAQLEARTGGALNAETGTAWHAVGVIHLTALHQYSEARDAFATALAIQEAVLGTDAAAVGTTLCRLAQATGRANGDHTTQQALAERGLAILERTLGPSHLEVAYALTAQAHIEFGDAQAQKAVLERALTILQAHYGPDHVTLAGPLTNLGYAYGLLGDHTTKKALDERALAILERRYGPDNAQLIGPLTGLGNAYGALDDPFTKLRMLERARALCEQAFGPNHVRLAVILCSLADVNKDLEDYERVRALALRALAIFQLHYGPDHILVAVALLTLADVANYDGQLATSLVLLKQVLAIQEAFYRSDRPPLAVTLLKLGGTCTDLGDADAARPYLARCLAIIAAAAQSSTPPTATDQRIVREARVLLARLDGGSCLIL